MARESSITQEQVNAAADEIRATGAKPTPRAVRERLGSGSMATVLKLLHVWQGGQVKPTDQAITLPATLQRYLADLINQEVSTARAGLEADLASAQTTISDLITESERQAATIDNQAQYQSEQYDQITKDKGIIEQLQADLARTSDIALQERQAAEHARTELAKALLRLEAVPDLQTRCDDMRKELDQERQIRTEAQKAQAVAEAKLAAANVRCEDFEKRAVAAEQQILGLHAKAQSTTDDARSQAKTIATLNGELIKARADLENTTRELAIARDLKQNHHPARLDPPREAKPKKENTDKPTTKAKS